MDHLDSKTRIKDAFLELLETEHIEKITIAGIIQKAGVSRTTYYRYYYEQREILADIVADFIKKLDEASSRIGTPDIFPENNLQYTLNVYMEVHCYYENADLLRKLYRSDVADYLREQIYEHFSHSYDHWMMSAADHPTREISITKEDYDFFKRYSFAGNYDIIRGWIMGGCKTSIDDLVSFIVRASAVNSQFISVK